MIHLSPSKAKIAKNCHVISDDLVVFEKLQQLGKPCKFRVFTAEAGNKGSLEIATSKQRGLSVEITDQGEGIYLCEVFPSEVGSYNLFITWSGSPIHGSPFDLTFEEKKATKITGLDLNLEHYCIGDLYQFNVNCRDLDYGQLEVKSDPTNATNIEVKYVDEKTFQLSLRPVNEGDLSLLVEYSGMHIDGSPFMVTNYRKCQKLRTESDKNEKGEDMVVFIVTTEGAKPGEMSANFKDVSGGPIPDIGIVKDATDPKLYKVAFIISNNTQYLLNIMYAGKHVEGSPFELTIGKPPQEPQSTGPQPHLVKAYGPGLLDGLLGENRGEFTVETREAGSGSLSVNVYGPRDSFKINMQPKSGDSRTILVQYDPKSVGEYLIEVKWADEHIPNSPFKINIQENKWP